MRVVGCAGNHRFELHCTLGNVRIDEPIAHYGKSSDAACDAIIETIEIARAVVPVDQDRDPTSVSVPSGPDGRFVADLGGFNLRAGDRLYLYVIQPGDNHFLQYIDDGVDGPEEPMPVATATAGVPPPRPSPIEPPRATATAIPRASDRTPVYLPLTNR